MQYNFLLDKPKDISFGMVNTGQGLVYQLTVEGIDQQDGQQKTESFSLNDQYVKVRIQTAPANKFLAVIDTDLNAPTSYDTLIGITADYTKVKADLEKNAGNYAAFSIIIDDITVHLDGQAHDYSLQDQSVTIHITNQSGNEFKYELWSEKA